MFEDNRHPAVMPHVEKIRPICSRGSVYSAEPNMNRRPNRAYTTLEARADQILHMDRAGLITDVDGTISRIVSDPAIARIDPEIVDSIRRLIQHLSLVALVSGRSISQLRAIMSANKLVYVGNHGMERWEEGRTVLVPGAVDYVELTAAALARIRHEVSLPGVILENKGVTGTIHYRLSPDPAAARRAILAASLDAARTMNLRVAEGRKSVNLLPNIPFDKGTAVETLVRDHQLAGVIYLGDDSTDVDAFRALRRLADSRTCQVLLVGVCVPESPHELHAEADFCLPGVDAVADFLRECSRSWVRRPVA